jgi:Ca-activated chloride channel family protein
MPSVLRLAGLLLGILALARPQLSHRDVVVESEGLDILLAIDTSGSMRIEDMPTGSQVANRLSVAKGVAAEFVEGRPHDRIGVVVFGEEAFTHVPLTLDHSTLIEVLDTLDIGMAGSRATAVGTAIAVSARRINQVKAPERIIILVTDGRSTPGLGLAPLDAAEAAKALGIRVYTIGIGQPTTVLGLQLGNGLDDGTLQSVAEFTGGKHFRATDLRSLQAVYDTIGELEVSPAEVTEVVEHDELFRALLAPGLVCLLMHLVLSATWLRRGP